MLMPTAEAMLNTSCAKTKAGAIEDYDKAIEISIPKAMLMLTTTEAIAKAEG